MKKTILISSLMIVLNGCGGDKSPSADNSPSTQDVADKIGVGYYIDAAVEGVEYTCGSESGVTDSNGTFTFEEGEECIFTLGDMVLRQVDASELENNMILIENNLETSRLLQTLDNDGDSDNGIQIMQGVIDGINAGDFTEIPVTDEDLGTLFQNIEGVEGYDGTMVSLQEAQSHLQSTFQELNLSADIFSNFNLVDEEMLESGNFGDYFNEEDLDNLDTEFDNMLNGRD